MRDVEQLNRRRVLDAIAAAQASAGAGFDQAAHAATSVDYRVDRADGVDVVALFVDRLVDYKARVLDLRGSSSPEVVSARIGTALADLGCTTVVVPAALPGELRPAGIEIREDHALSHGELDRTDAAVTTCAVAIAETGTIILDHSGSQGRRAVTLVPDVHACLVHEDQIRGTVPEALRGLGAPPLTTWISGPSATSDIELSRVEGVHGPRTLVVVIHR